MLATWTSAAAAAAPQTPTAFGSAVLEYLKRLLGACSSSEGGRDNDQIDG